MIMNIISASRRTDIPAFYGDWFMNRIKDRFVDVINPYNKVSSQISLDLKDVFCIVFWSKNFIPFTDYLKQLKSLGYNFYFNYTITGLHEDFECNLVKTFLAVDNMKLLSDLFSPESINWRYDPIVMSNKTDIEYHIDTFRSLCQNLNGYVKRCYFSFLTPYSKIKSNIVALEGKDIYIENYSKIKSVELANQLSVIANENNIDMYSCCGDFLVNEKIKKAHCVDADIIKSLFGEIPLSEKPTRINCGCYESYDIGSYDSCPHGCMYCYANINKASAIENYKLHDKNSSALNFKIPNIQSLF